VERDRRKVIPALRFRLYCYLLTRPDDLRKRTLHPSRRDRKIAAQAQLNRQGVARCQSEALNGDHRGGSDVSLICQYGAKFQAGQRFYSPIPLPCKERSGPTDGFACGIPFTAYAENLAIQ
jgi:hypothetical protein